jgi:tetratricopeptide (TPR) repeat protein/predicted Ser/Thr protein kinase
MTRTTRGDAGGDLEAAGEPAVSALEPMVRVRPAEPMGAQLARARVLGALFGPDSTVGAFGRFRVLERLGAGGMGVVYEAYDPDLARGVALKLVNVAAKDRETALAEAQALARLSHPNVVPIYDVGIERDHVYLVMELVRGKTLRQWGEGRRPREILEIYQQAGRALLAAHDVGLVHRDFKPENAIVGTDGRVRVVDFGLACQADDPAAVIAASRGAAGTPRFIAPELLAGAAITPAADQYSFCVALAEGLAAAREPMPRRIAGVLERGRAAAPGDRFATMGDLLRALARDPARAWRRGSAVGGLAISVGAIAFVIGRQTPSEAEACDGGGAQLEAAWSPTARAAALDRLATLGAYGQSLRPLLERGLESYLGHWGSEYHAACRDRRSRAETDTMSDRRATCLRRGSDALAAVGDLVLRAGPLNLPELPRAVQSMPDPASCSDRDALSSEIAPPPPGLAALVARVRRTITHAEIERGAGRYDEALAEARSAVAEARALGYGPALAEALVVEGHAQMTLDRQAALPALAEATTVAMSARADALAVEAWARRAWAQGMVGDPGAALAGLDVIEPLAERTASAAFARALLYNNLGSVELARDRTPEARAYLERALAESRAVAGGGALELVTIRKNLALVTERPQADRLLSEVAVELTERLGPTHPDTLQARWLRGSTTIEDLRQAADILAPVCRAYELHVALVVRTARCWTELALVRWDLDDRDGAADAMARAVQVPDEVPEAAPYVALLRGNARDAARQFAAAIAAMPGKPGEPGWQTLSRAVLTLGLGRARRELGELGGAREVLERTIADVEPIVRGQPSTSYERRLGRARVELAQTLASLNAPAPERAAVAKVALAWLRQVGGPPREIASLLKDLGVP